MAKLKFSKFKFDNPKVNTITFQEQEIEVKTYLPINDKLIMIGNIINNSADELKFYNVGKLELFFALEIVYNYTNISFTDKQKDDVCKLYDTIYSSGLYQSIIDAIGEEEIYMCHDILMETVNSIYKYNNSAMGILDAISQDYSALNLDASEIQKKLADPENLDLLRNIMGKLG